VIIVPSFCLFSHSLLPPYHTGFHLHLLLPSQWSGTLPEGVLAFAQCTKQEIACCIFSSKFEPVLLKLLAVLPSRMGIFCRHDTPFDGQWVESCVFFIIRALFCVLCDRLPTWHFPEDRSRHHLTSTGVSILPTPSSLLFAFPSG
jgi:hypothetical protein